MNSLNFEIVSQLAPGGVLRVSLIGDFDMSLGSTLSDALVAAARQADVRQVVVDLRRTTFLDSHSLAALVAGFDAAVPAGRRFTVTNATGIVKQVLDVTGLSEVFTDRPDAS